MQNKIISATSGTITPLQYKHILKKEIENNPKIKVANNPILSLIDRAHLVNKDFKLTYSAHANGSINKGEIVAQLVKIILTNDTTSRLTDKNPNGCDLVLNGVVYDIIFTNSYAYGSLSDNKINDIILINSKGAYYTTRNQLKVNKHNKVMDAYEKDLFMSL